jgi:DHA2 family methylenomycin A resistance protein-like MFS transporter
MIAAALAIGWWAIPRIPPRPARARFDLLGALLLSALLLGLAGLLAVGMRSMPLTAVLAGAVVLALLAVAFARWEMVHPDPLLRPALLVHRGFGSASAAVATSNLAMYSTLLTLPILLSRHDGWSSAQIGLTLTALSAGTALFAPVGGRLADRIGRRWTTAGGLALLTLGVLPLALAGAALPATSLLAGLGLAGVGLGISSAPMQTSAVESVGPEEAGAASGLFSTSRYLGSIVGSILLAALLGPADDPSGYAAVFALVFAAALISALVSLGLHDWPEGALVPRKAAP